MKKINLQQRSLKNKLKELKQKRLKVGERKGITLIALVITIIVLLILAGVSIAMLTGENGILTKANEAKNKTQIADVKEQAQMDILAEQMKNEGGNISAEKLKEILEKYFENVPDADKLEEELKKEDGLKLKSQAQYGGQEIDIADIYSGEFEKSPITAEELDKSLQDKQKVQYVINYGIDIDGDKNAEDDWEIFYIEDYNGEGDDAITKPTTGKRIFLIASDYVKKDIKELQTAVGSDKANMSDSSGEWDDYCRAWSSSSIPTYHCILPNEGGSACTFPKLFEFSNYDIKTNASSNINSKCVASLLCTGNWSSFANNWADYATGGASVEMWMNSWNKRHSDNKVYYSGNGSWGYCIGSSESPNDFYEINLNNNNDDPLYFPHKENTGDFDGDGSEERCDGYWLASPSANLGSQLLYVYYSGYVTTDYYMDATYGVRPVVCLKSDVKLVKSSKKIEKEGIEAECYELVN